MKRICYIVGAGENYGLDFVPGEEDFVIAADGGRRYLDERGIEPDLTVGDFDSLDETPLDGRLLQLPVEKDDTDMFAAMKEGIRAGYQEFHLYCGTGGRIDHTVANIQLLAHLAERGLRGFLFDQDSVFTAIKDRKLEIEAMDAGYVSVFSYSERSVGVTLRNLKYELKDAVLTNSVPLGVSNEFVGRESSISVERGTLLVSLPRGAEKKIK